MRKSEKLFCHYLFEEYNTILLGFPKKNAEEDMDRSAGKNVNNSINVPMEEHLDLLFKEDNIGMEMGIVNENFPKLDTYDRTAFYNAMERWNTRELEKIKFVGKYWMILADFIYCTFGLSLNDIAGELLEVSEYIMEIPLDKKNLSDVKETRKLYYDVLDKMRSNKKTLRDMAEKIIKVVCLWFGITQDILRTGKGYMYVINMQKHPEMLSIVDVVDYCKECESHGKDLNIEEMMKEKMGVEDEDIGKVFLQIVEPRSGTDKKVAEFIDILLEEMVKSREKEIEARKRREEKEKRESQEKGESRN